MTTTEPLIASTSLRRKLTHYIAAYVNEELDRGNDISQETINNAIDAFEGGAGDDHETVTYKTGRES